MKQFPWRRFKPAYSIPAACGNTPHLRSESSIVHSSFAYSKPSCASEARLHKIGRPGRQPLQFSEACGSPISVRKLATLSSWLQPRTSLGHRAAHPSHVLVTKSDYSLVTKSILSLLRKSPQARVTHTPQTLTWPAFPYLIPAAKMKRGNASAASAYPTPVSHPDVQAMGEFERNGQRNERVAIATIPQEVDAKRHGAGERGSEKFETRAVDLPLDPEKVRKGANDHAAPVREGAGPEVEQALHPEGSHGDDLPPVHLPKRDAKPRLVILGSGWGACRVLRSVDPARWDVVAISPRNHMVFTPLLSSTAVGTLEPRSVAIPVRSLQAALNTPEDTHFYFHAACSAIDPARRWVHCQSAAPGDARAFSVEYDRLVVAVGATANTFGIRGVAEHALLLREIEDARKIRAQLILNLMKANIPGTTEEQKRRLLSCVVVGGGPTGVEFSGELSDFIHRDVRSKFPNLRKFLHVSLVEAGEVLSSFDESLRQYAIRVLTQLRRGTVCEVGPTHVELNDGTRVPYGLLVWSTGIGATPFVKALTLPKTKGGRIATDQHLRVVGAPDVYAIGDCAAYDESLGLPPLPCLAQVAEREGAWLAKRLNRMAKEGCARAGMTDAEDSLHLAPFVYKQLGSMASVGSYRALIDVRQAKDQPGFSMKGFLSFLAWRSAYLTRIVTWRTRLYVIFNWFTTLLFGRDISRF
eukprot:jgi/Mesen1/6989/ME000364S06163